MSRLKNEADASHIRLLDMEKRQGDSTVAAKELEDFLVQAIAKSSEVRGTLDGAQSQTLEARKHAESLGEDRMLALEQLSAAQKKQGAAAAELQHLQTNEEEWLDESEIRYSRLTERRKELESVAQELLGAEKENQEITSALEKNRTELEQAIGSLEEAKTEAQKLHQERVASETQCSILQSLKTGGEGMEDGVKYLLEQGNSLHALLIDVLKVQTAFIPSIEKALGKTLQTVLVQDRNQALELLSLLKAGSRGEAIFGWPVVLGFKRTRPDFSQESGFQGWLIEKVSFPDEWRGLLEWALGHHALVSTLESALALTSHTQGLDIWFWTAQGEAFHGSGIVQGGSPATESAYGGLLQRRVELQEAESRLEGLKIQIENIQTKVSTWESKRVTLVRESEDLRARGKLAEQRMHEMRTRVQLGDGQTEALAQEMDQYRIKLQALAERKVELTRNVEELNKECTLVEESRQTLENRFQVSLEQVQYQEGERNRIEQEWRKLESDRGESEAKLQSFRSQISFLLRGAEEIKTSLERSATQSEEWIIQGQLLREKLATTAEELDKVHGRLTEEEKDRDAIKMVYDAKINRLEERRILLRRLQDDLREVTQQVHQHSLQIEQLRAASKSIRERMFENHEVDFGAEEVVFESIPYDSDTAPERIAELKDKLKSLGNINAGALEDYEAEKARLNETQTQFEDLDKARQGLERAIKKLDKAAREQFLTTFSLVRKNFQEVFSSLFEGGEAQLAIEEGVDPLDAKIEINARPTGKKMRGVSLLSGGERALTAISLLFALYLVRPSPYCIMDEVDGPLDDANIGRFVNLLRRFSHQTQFIVVTHNKRTMAASDMLYGVTQEIKGVSKLVAVQLDEAARIAA